MSIRYAFVTLLTSDTYLPGALAIAGALKDIHRSLQPDQTVEYETVCLVTPETVDVTTIRLLRKAFNVIVGVEIIVPPDTEALTLLGRPDLDTALTKLHVFRLTQYSKVVFLDADVLPLRPLSHLFHLDHEFSAVPDVGWPDIFNSGVIVLSPGEDKFEELRELLNTKGTWDGADQGLLNEWRGSNWNRLSFTYNTTPTAIYTYAPAYQRFGSQISVIHFIGPHKPWHSIPCRQPGSSAPPADMVARSSTKAPAAHQHPYSYDSLVDHWYSVYDQHYQSQATDPVFQPTRYTSAWNEEGRRAVVAGGVLGLEDLRRAALEGMGASGILTPRAHGEGEYRTMPLDGRFDLIRPRTRAEKEQMQATKDSTDTPESTPVSAESATTTPEPSTPLGQISSLSSGSPVRWTTLPTPGVNEIPPAPHTRLISLPSTPLRHVPVPYKPPPHTREAGAQTIMIQSQQPGPVQTNSSLMPLMRDSAVRTPPNVITPAPTDTYFPKVWKVDRNWSSVSPSSSETSLTTMEPSPSKPLPDPHTFINLPFVPTTPEIHHQGQYGNIIGEENKSPNPDPAKVKRVFPWEDRPRYAPGRVFPGERSPLTALSHPPVTGTPERKVAFRSPIPSPLVGFPPSLQVHHPSDSPLPQRYASKVSLSVPSSGPFGPESGLDKVETGSQDGDVEDEVDSEEETAKPQRRSANMGMAKRILKYRSIGVQTDPREMREEGVQVITFVPVAEIAEKLISMNKRLMRDRSTFAEAASSSNAATTRISTLASSPSPDSRYATFSPNTCDYRESITLVPNEAGDLILPFESSAVSSASPSSPSGTPAHIRKGTRVWDPARDVEAFKRGSEEILTKFTKTGAREERA